MAQRTQRATYTPAQVAATRRGTGIRRWRPYLFVLPTGLFLFVGTFFLLVYALVVSFTRYDLQFNPNWTWAGLANYTEALHDPLFWRSLGQTMWIAIPALVLEFSLGLALALFLNRPFRGRALAVSLISTPVMISATAAGMSFRLLYAPKYGPINDILSRLTGHQQEIDWLGSINLARPSMVFVDMWHASPFFMLLLLAGLQGIPDDLFEAARVDGANTWQVFTGITLPLLKPVIVLGLLLRAIDLSRIFDFIFIMTKGGPGTQTQTISYYVYTQGLQNFRVGYAAAMAWLLCIVTIAFAKVFLSVTSKEGGA